MCRWFDSAPGHQEFNKTPPSGGVFVFWYADAMSTPRIAVLTILALVAFAGNSLLCRAALTRTDIDAASFTAVRLGGMGLGNDHPGR